MNNVNYDKIFEDIKEKNIGKKLLLQVCCAPCFSGVYERINGFDTTLFFFNPNITKKDEYEKRLAELERFVKKVYGETTTIINGGFNSKIFFDAVKGLEEEPEGGARCKICYALRLLETAKRAKEYGFDFFCTTLSVSPYKNAKMLNEIGVQVGKEYGVEYLVSDFKKQNGYKKSIENSKKYGLYRQNYCGCTFSERDRIKKQLSGVST